MVVLPCGGLNEMPSIFLGMWILGPPVGNHLGRFRRYDLARGSVLLEASFEVSNPNPNPSWLSLLPPCGLRCELPGASAAKAT